MTNLPSMGSGTNLNSPFLFSSSSANQSYSGPTSSASTSTLIANKLAAIRGDSGSASVSSSMGSSSQQQSSSSFGSSSSSSSASSSSTWAIPTGLVNRMTISVGENDPAYPLESAKSVTTAYDDEVFQLQLGIDGLRGRLSTTEDPTRCRQLEISIADSERVLQEQKNCLANWQNRYDQLSSASVAASRIAEQHTVS